MMKQVNMWIDDELYMLLVKDAGKRMMQDGIYVKPSKAAALIIAEHLGAGNNTPNNDSIQDEEQDDEQETNPFADLDI